MAKKLRVLVIMVFILELGGGVALAQFIPLCPFSADRLGMAVTYHTAHPGPKVCVGEAVLLRLVVDEGDDTSLLLVGEEGLFAQGLLPDVGHGRRYAPSWQRNPCWHRVARCENDRSGQR